MRQNQLIQCAWIGDECCLHSTCLWERNHHWSDDVVAGDGGDDYGVDYGGRVRERQQQPLMDSCDEHGHGHGEDESMIVAVVELQSFRTEIPLLPPLLVLLLLLLLVVITVTIGGDVVAVVVFELFFKSRHKTRTFEGGLWSKCGRKVVPCTMRGARKDHFPLWTTRAWSEVDRIDHTKDHGWTIFFS